MAIGNLWNATIRIARKTTVTEGLGTIDVWTQVWPSAMPVGRNARVTEMGPSRAGRGAPALSFDDEGAGRIETGAKRVSTSRSAACAQGDLVHVVSGPEGAEYLEIVSVSRPSAMNAPHHTVLTVRPWRGTVPAEIGGGES